MEEPMGLTVRCISAILRKKANRNKISLTLKIIN